MRLRWSPAVVAILAALPVVAPIGTAPQAHAALPSAISIQNIPDQGFPVRGVSENGQWLLGTSNGLATPLSNWITGEFHEIPGSATGMSSDARFVVTVTFQALVPADTVPGSYDLYRWDRLQNKYALLAATPAGYSIQNPHISDNGTVAAFTAVQSGTPNGKRNVWTVVVGNAATQLKTSGGGLAAFPINEVQDLTPDGRYLLFRTGCASSCPASSNGDMRRYDRLSGVTLRVSVSNGGVSSNGWDEVGSISPNGRFVTWRTTSTNLGTGSSASGALFVRDIASNKTIYLGPKAGDGRGFTDDAGRATFPGQKRISDNSLRETVYLRDIPTGATVDIGRDNRGVAVQSDVSMQAISAGGAELVVRSSDQLTPVTNSSLYLVGLRGVPTEKPTPNRLLDTRIAVGIGTTTPIPAQQVVTVQVTGRAGIPLDATAVFVNLAIVKPAALGFAKIYACDNDPGQVSSINFAAGQNVANFTMARLSAAGTVCIWSNVSAHMLVDFQRIVTDFTSITPVRLLDTRQPADSPTPLNPNEVRPLHVTDANGVDGTTQAVAINLTVVSPAATGFIQVFPCDENNPTIAASHFVAARNKANFVVAVPDADGDICFKSTARMALVIDLVGYVPEVSQFELQLVRMQALVTYLGGRILMFQLPSRPSNSNDPLTEAMISITAVNPKLSGYVSAFQCGSPVPAVSVLNFTANILINNVAVVPVDNFGRICLFVSQDVHPVIDLLGEFWPPLPTE